ncbi:unnamed protein product [Polarella glacialis]|uniref:Uncharacterized protein n=1 Tax=Polarella glacialis TaxID=89957 RepID=A0A813JMC7_POLGL|nr:unnamed protein product [Polarella glacialis]
MEVAGLSGHALSIEHSSVPVLVLALLHPTRDLPAFRAAGTQELALAEPWLLAALRARLAHHRGSVRTGALKVLSRLAQVRLSSASAGTSSRTLGSGPLSSSQQGSWCEARQEDFFAGDQIADEVAWAAEAWLDESDSEVHVAALREIIRWHAKSGASASLPRAISRLARGRTTSRETRGWALEALGRVAVAAQRGDMGDALATAAEFVQDDHAEIRVAALLTLMRLSQAAGCSTDAVVSQVVLKCLLDEHWLVRAVAVTMLSRLASHTPETLIAVTGMLGDLDDFTRGAAQRCLAFLLHRGSDAPTEEAVENIDGGRCRVTTIAVEAGKLLCHEDGSARAASVELLSQLAGNFGAGRAAWHAAARALSDSQSEAGQPGGDLAASCRQAALMALSRILLLPGAAPGPPEEATRLLAKGHLNDTDSGKVRLAAARGLCRAALSAADAEVAKAAADQVALALDMSSTRSGTEECWMSLRKALQTPGLLATDAHCGLLARRLAEHLPQLNGPENRKAALDLLWELREVSDTNDLVFPVALAAASAEEQSGPVRAAAASVLGMTACKACADLAHRRTAIGVLLERLATDVDSNVRLAAAKVLGSLAGLDLETCASYAGAVVESLVKCVSNNAEEISVRAAAAAALSCVFLGPAVRQVLQGGGAEEAAAAKALRAALSLPGYRELELRLASLDALGLILCRDGKPATAMWHVPLGPKEEADPQELCAALVALGRTAGKGDFKSLHRALPFLSSTEPEVRKAATETLLLLQPDASGTPLGPELQAVQEKLVAHFTHRHGGVRKSAVETLARLSGRMGSGKILSEVKALLRHKYTGARDSAAEALGLLALPEDHATIHLLAERLEDDEYFVRKAAAAALGRLAGAPPSGGSSLDTDPRPGQEAARAAAFRVLADAEDVHSQIAALDALVQICSRGDSLATAAMWDCWEDSSTEIANQNLRSKLLEALGTLAGGASSGGGANDMLAAAECCLVGLRDASFGVAREAFAALVQLASEGGPEGAAAAAAVAPALFLPISSRVHSEAGLQRSTQLQDDEDPGAKSVARGPCGVLMQMLCFLELEWYFSEVFALNMWFLKQALPAEERPAEKRPVLKPVVRLDGQDNGDKVCTLQELAAFTSLGLAPPGSPEPVAVVSDNFQSNSARLLVVVPSTGPLGAWDAEVGAGLGAMGPLLSWAEVNGYAVAVFCAQALRAAPAETWDRVLIGSPARCATVLVGSGMLEVLRAALRPVHPLLISRFRTVVVRGSEAVADVQASEELPEELRAHLSGAMAFAPLAWDQLEPQVARQRLFELFQEREERWMSLEGMKYMGFQGLKQNDMPGMKRLGVDERIKLLDRDRNDDELARLLKKHDKAKDRGSVAEEGSDDEPGVD